MEKERTAQLERVIRQEHPNVAGIVVRKDGEAVYEKYFNGCTGASRVHVFSVTKSVVSALVGIAIDKEMCIRDRVYADRQHGGGGEPVQRLVPQQERQAGVL